MTDLESRVREEFHSDPAWRSPDILIDDVRRGARRRRGRRTTGLLATGGVAAAAVVLASTGGVGGGVRQLLAALPGHANLNAGTSAISVTGSGQLYKVTSNQGCAIPCSTIWKQTGAGWTKLSAFHGGTGTSNPVIEHLSMAPNGQDGWAWGDAFYSTHDAGATWTRITNVPYNSDYSFDVQVGPTDAWATSTKRGSPIRPGQDQQHTLWHTGIASDDWIQVTPPMVPARSGTRIEATAWDIVDVLPHGRVALAAGYSHAGNPIYVGDDGGWREEKVPCRHSANLFDGTIPPREICGPSGRYLNWGAFAQPAYSTFQVGLHRLGASAPIGQPDMLFVRNDQASIDTPSGVVPSDLQLGADDAVSDWSESGDHVAILTTGHRVFLSNDNGRHWHEE